MDQEFKFDEKEYKKLSVSFRRVASRFIRSHFRESNDNLARFLIFIEESPVIYEFIQENNVKQFDIEDIIQRRGYNDKFKLPVRESEEIAFIYQLLKHIQVNDIDYVNIAMGYNDGRKLQEAVDKFNNQVAKPLIDHIVSYLGEMAIDMGLDKKSGTQFNIREFRGQLNHADGHAQISANQTYNETKVEELKDIAQKFAQALIEDTSIPDTDKEDTVELVEAAVQEVESEKPKKVIVRTAMDQVRTVNDVAGAGANVITLGTQLLQMFQGFIG
ncbi:hypothetical protein [Cytobacillus oceanisediminis]|uniref:hypothetical protein n=1 Tax=Cytobacillus oceanisediminis TaxID=665099 RepID=UPI0024940D36|nr:hypothetical protein [Cytobacillus oceanisediminis]